MDYGRPDRADALASEYVAGTLRGPARRRFETLLPSHPALRAAVQRWQARLMPLTLAVPPEPPPAHLWQGIEQRLWPAIEAAPAPRWWQQLAPWRALSGVAVVAVLGLSLVLSQPQPVQPPVVVVLESTGKDPALAGSVVASFSGDGRSAVARPIVPVAMGGERVLELWWAPAQGAPKSLGLIKANGVTVLSRGQLPGGLKGSGIDHMAVSVEPPGGSPTGQPTGPVVFYGKLTL
ncbi:MAG: anti-sigma factor [Rubrivivax sp.]|nr:anti-sigma factor [Rubrivivax sp.]